MLTSRLLLSAAALSLASVEGMAQQIIRRPAERAFTMTRGDDDRPRLGLTTSAGSPRDTLGLLVNDVTRDGPAAKAGIEEGDRLVSINGVNLRLAASDLDDEEMAGVASRRLIRELGKLKVGDVADLRVYREGQTRSVKVPTVALDDLQPARSASSTIRSRDDRASIGISLGGSTSRRDTLGVLVASVVDDGPADKARIEEGDRIAAINGVDLRVPPADAGDWQVASSRMRRLTREMEKLKAGDEVELRLMRGGQARTVRVKTVAGRDLPRSASGFTIGGEGGFFSDGNNFSFTIPDGRGSVRISPPDGAAGFLRFDDGEPDQVRLRLSPERRAEIEERMGDIMRRFNNGQVIVRPRSRVQIIESPRAGGTITVRPGGSA